MEVSLQLPSRIWVAAPGRLKRLLKKIASRDRVEWCYLGSDVSMSERADKELGRARRVFIGDALAKIADDLREAFIDWVAEIGERQKDKVNWWASRLASRSPLQTDFFLLVCYSRLAHAWISGPTDGPARILVVEDPWLRWVLGRRFAANPRVLFHGRCLSGCFERSVYWFARIPLAMGLMLLSSIRALLTSRLLFSQAPRDLKGSRNQAVLIYTWIERQSVSLPGKIRDAHTGRLEEILRNKGESVLRLTPLDFPGKLLRRLRSLSSTLVITPRYVRLVDVLQSLRSRFRIENLTEIALFQGWDYRPLFYRELLLEWGSTSYRNYHLWYHTMRRVAAKSGRKVKCLIYPFENQPWEKLMCLAWREKARHVQLIGYQHSRVPPLLLPYALGKKEIGTLPLPDKIVTNGEATLESLRAAGFPVAKLANGGALRYEYFHSDNGNGSHPSPGPEAEFRKKRKIVLVAFPLSRPHCKSLLLDLLDEFKEPLFVDDRGKIPVQMVLKCHPWLPLQMFYRGKMNLPPCMTFTEEPMEKELARAGLLLYVPSTTSWREAYVAGVPVLKYDIDLLDIDPPELFNGFSVYSCRKETLRSSIQKLLQNPPARTKPSPDAIGKIFGRVDEELWVKLVGQAASGSAVTR